MVQVILECVHFGLLDLQPVDQDVGVSEWKGEVHEVFGPAAVFFELEEILLEVAEDALEDGQLVESQEEVLEA